MVGQVAPTSVSVNPGEFHLDLEAGFGARGESYVEMDEVGRIMRNAPARLRARSDLRGRGHRHRNYKVAHSGHRSGLRPRTRTRSQERPQSTQMSVSTAWARPPTGAPAVTLAPSPLRDAGG